MIHNVNIDLGLSMMKPKLMILYLIFVGDNAVMNLRKSST